MKSITTRIRRTATALMLTAALAMSSPMVLPDRAYAAGAADIRIGDLIDIGNKDAAGYTGETIWRVLDKADDGSMLLMSEYLWRGNGTDANAGISFVTQGSAKEVNGQVLYWRGTNAEIWCNEFESAILDGVEGLVVKTTTGSDPEFYYTQSLYAENNNKEIHFAAADAVLYENGVFFLSAEEADKYMKDPRSRTALMPNADSASQWLLRSSQSSTNWASEVKPDGELTAVTAGTRRAARPVFRAGFAEGTTFVSAIDENGVRTWTIGKDQQDPSGGDPENPLGGNQGPDAQKAAEEKAKTITSVSVGGSTVDAASVRAAIAAAGGSTDYVTEIVLNKSVKKIRKKAFAGTKVTTLVVKSRKLRKKSVKGALKGSAVTTVKVQVGKTRTNKTYVKKYKKIFTKKNAGKNVKVRK